MNIINKIGNWFKPDLDAIVQVISTDYEGKKSTSELMTAEMADNLSEAFLKKTLVWNKK